MAIMFRAAVKDRVLPTSPCVDIKLPKIPPKSSLVPISTQTVLSLREAIARATGSSSRWRPVPGCDEGRSSD
jgi:hypothetical protein